MRRFDRYPAGVPCFVDTVTTDLPGVRPFYEGVFGWELVGPGRTQGEPPGEYWVARVDGLEVAAIGTLGGGVTSPPPGWNTHIAVGGADAAVDAARKAGGAVLAGPFDAAPAGRMAVVADPTGARLVLWEAGARHGAQLANSQSAWAMSALSTPDPERAAAFYGDVFGWRAEPFEDAGRGAVLFRLPGYVGGEPGQPVPRDVVAAAMPSGPDDAALWNVDFWIADAERAAHEAARLGGAVLDEPHDAPPFRRAVLAAPDGAAFSVSQHLH